MCKFLVLPNFHSLTLRNILKENSFLSAYRIFRVFICFQLKFNTLIVSYFFVVSLTTTSINQFFSSTLNYLKKQQQKIQNIRIMGNIEFFEKIHNPGARWKVEEFFFALTITVRDMFPVCLVEADSIPRFLPLTVWLMGVCTTACMTCLKNYIKIW